MSRYNLFFASFSAYFLFLFLSRPGLCPRRNLFCLSKLSARVRARSGRQGRRAESGGQAVPPPPPIARFVALAHHARRPLPRNPLIWQVGYFNLARLFCFLLVPSAAFVFCFSFIRTPQPLPCSIRRLQLRFYVSRARLCLLGGSPSPDRDARLPYRMLSFSALVLFFFFNFFFFPESVPCFEECTKPIIPCVAVRFIFEL